MKSITQTALFLFGCSMHQVAFPESLEDAVHMAIKTNPNVAASVQRYYASRADLEAAFGNFLPSIDLTADTGREDIDRIGTVTDSDQTRARASLQLSVPIFRGFANENEYERANLSMQASYYDSLAQAEELALKIARAYTDVLNAKDVVTLSIENLALHERTYELVAARKKQGVSDKADLTQMLGRLSRVKANLLAAKNNMGDAETTYKQLVGYRPAQLVRPEINAGYIPESNERAATLALSNSQSLLASRINAQALGAKAEAFNSHIYPNFDFVADQTWNDKVDGARGHENELSFLVKMNWNLYSGGRSSSKQAQAKYDEEVARMNSNRIYREVRANVDSSWDAFVTLRETLVHLQDYVDQSAESARLYMAQFEAGRRTLLDLLDAQNELFEARKQFLASDYNYIYTQYRVVASMSYILDAMQLNVMEPLLANEIESNQTQVAN